MKIKYSGFIVFSAIMGMISFNICRFFVHFDLAFLLAVFTFMGFFGFFYILMQIQINKYKNIDIPDSRIRFKALATHYTNKLEGDGILLLTDESLYFFRKNKGKYDKTEIPLEQIHNAFIRTASIVRLELKDGSAIEFLTGAHKAFLSELNNRI